MRTGFQTYEATVKKQRGSMMGGSALQHLFCGRCGMVVASRVLRPETFDSAKNEAALRLDQGGKNLTLLSYSYCITGISGPADT